MRVLVIGLGVTGEAVVRFASARGDEVTVVEEQPGSDRYRAWAEEASRLGVSLVESPRSAAWRDLVAESDLVVPSPGVPEQHVALVAARAAGVAIRSEIDLAAELAPMPLVAVAGTNGKTTVTTLIAAMLEASGVRAVAAGNIGRPLLDAITDRVDVVVVEVSSFQLRFVTEAFRPKVAVLLNVADDHLDWHPTLEAYAAAKQGVFRYQRDDDLLVVCGDDAVATRLAEDAPARRLEYHVMDTIVGFGMSGDPLGGVVTEAFRDTDVLSGLRPVDRGNAIAAAAAALAAGGTPQGVRDALQEFRGLPHRVQLVGKAGEVEYYDDSKATNPHATLRAVEGFEHVVLLAGGRNKGLDLMVLRQIAPRLRSVVAIGEAAVEVERVFDGLVPVDHATSMHEAVLTAAVRAQAGDTVLLSPACASFDWYDNYGARGDDFAREVRGIMGEAGDGDDR